MEWSLLIALAVFLVSIGDDVLIVFYVRRVMHGQLLIAALLSGAITAMSNFGIVQFSNNWLYSVPNILGSLVGTPLAMLLEQRTPVKKPRDKKGRFKPPVSTASFQEIGKVP